MLFLAGAATLLSGCGRATRPLQLGQDPPDTLVNECFIFDCAGGALGGLVEWCTDRYRAFDDCP